MCKERNPYGKCEGFETASVPQPTVVERPLQEQYDWLSAQFLQYQDTFGVQRNRYREALLHIRDCSGSLVAARQTASDALEDKQ